MTDMVNLAKDDALLISRREMDAHYLARLKILETELSELEKRIRHELADMETHLSEKSFKQEKTLQKMEINIQNMIDRQHNYEPAMESLKNVISAGLVMRWIIIGVVGAMAAIGTAATAFDVMKSWVK